MKYLIIIDAQEDFTRGVLRNEEAIAAIPNIQKLIEKAHTEDFCIIATKDTHHKENYMLTQEGKNLPIPHCILNTPGWEICHELLEKTNFEHIICKGTFGYTEWYKLLSPEEIWLCGFCTDICVSANFQILKAQFPEVPIKVFADCCAGVTPELHEAALKVMQSCQATIVKGV